jgi:O-antigen/teichoic acid export membrane protein
MLSRREFSPSGKIDISKMPNVQTVGRKLIFDPLSWSRTRQVSFSIADQALSVGGMFLVNIALARTQTKEAYGIFTLSYTVLTFLTGLHNAAVLETFTIYGSGRYLDRYEQYVGLLWRVNAALAVGLTVALLFLWRALAWSAPNLASGAFLGVSLTCGVLLTASFVRRTFYLQRRPDLAARFSLIFFLVCIFLLGVFVRIGRLDGFYAFVIVACAWIVAGLSLFSALPSRSRGLAFTSTEPGYWSEHWKYSRWVFVTALVFQFTTQGYYWLAAAFLSVKEVANLRAMYNVVTPVDQIFVATAMLMLPIMSSRYSSRHLEGLLGIWKRYALFSIVVTGSFALIVRFFGRAILHLFYGSRFDDTAALVGTFALFPVFMCIGNTINAALKAMEKPNIVFWAYLASGTTTLVLGLPLMIHFGLRGAVYGIISSAGSYTLALAIGWYLIKRSARRAVQPTSFLNELDPRSRTDTA